MKFCHSKEERECKGCTASILEGEEIVVIRLTVRPGMKVPVFFHTYCFQEWSNEMYNYRLSKWKATQTENKVKPKLGRPRKYKNYLKSGRLQSLIYYYAKKDNVEKVSELVGKLRELRA